MSRFTRVHARWWSRVLDGDHVWGSIGVWSSRYGVSRYRLVVFPPGISGAQRRLLRLWRAWLTWGALLWLTSEICLGGILTPWTVLGFSTIVYLSAGAVTLALAGDLRSQVRTLSVVVVDRRPDRSAAMYAEWETLVGLLTDADDLREQGRLSAIDHDAEWRRVYDRLGPGRPHSIEERSSI